ncbi:MAG: hypothetical protein M1839_001657 [Geoglossum umbratile]|nr:MAG: hypothetical protein M1839_001657 [Geoglossum umbratile]
MLEPSETVDFTPASTPANPKPTPRLQQTIAISVEPFEPTSPHIATTPSSPSETESPSADGNAAREQLESFHSQLDDLKLKFDRRIAALADELSGLKKGDADARTKVDELRQVCKALRAENLALKAEKENLLHRIKELEIQNALLEPQVVSKGIDDLLFGNTALKDLEFAGIGERSAILERHFQRLGAMPAGIRNNIEDMTNWLQEVNTDLSQQRRDQHKRQVAAEQQPTSDEINKIQLEIKEAWEKGQQLDAQIQIVQDQNIYMKRQLKENAGVSLDRERRLHDLYSKLQELEKAKAELEQANNDLSRSVTLLQESNTQLVKQVESANSQLNLRVLQQIQPSAAPFQSGRFHRDGRYDGIPRSAPPPPGTPNVGFLGRYGSHDDTRPHNFFQ